MEKIKEKPNKNKIKENGEKKKLSKDEMIKKLESELAEIVKIYHQHTWALARLREID